MQTTHRLHIERRPALAHPEFTVVYYLRGDNEGRRLSTFLPQQAAEWVWKMLTGDGADFIDAVLRYAAVPGSTFTGAGVTGKAFTMEGGVWVESFGLEELADPVAMERRFAAEVERALMIGETT